MVSYTKKSQRDFHEELEEARKDPRFMHELDAFIKAAERVYPLE